MIISHHEILRSAIRDVAISKIGKHVIPLCRLFDDTSDFIATGTLIKEKSSYYLISAAHAMYDKKTKLPIDDKIGFILDKKWHSFEGRIFCTEIYSKTNPSNIDLDITIIKLSNTTVSLLEKHYDFFDLTRFGTTPDLREEQRYIVAGYPISNYDKYGNIVVVECFIFLTTSEKPEQINRNAIEHITVKYQPHNLLVIGSNTSAYGHWPEGMSGGAIFYVPTTIPDPNVTYFPVGIIIEYNNDFEVIAGTKLNIVMELIKNHFDNESTRNNGVKIECKISR